jgi:hypothetical protein
MKQKRIEIQFVLALNFTLFTIIICGKMVMYLRTRRGKKEKHVISCIKQTHDYYFVSANDIFPAMNLLFCHTTNYIILNISLLV